MSGRSGRSSSDPPAAVEDEHPPRCYLLFAGSPAPQGGLGDLVETFTSEATARQAFRHLRLSQSSASSWAQLAVVDGHHGIRPLSWFGIGAAPARTPMTFPRPEKLIHTETEGGVVQVAPCESPSPGRLEVEPSARRRPVKRIAVWLVGVVALGSITMGVVSGRSTRPVAPRPATMDGGGPAYDAVVPSSVDGSVLTDATSGFQR